MPRGRGAHCGVAASVLSDELVARACAHPLRLYRQSIYKSICTYRCSGKCNSTDVAHCASVDGQGAEGLRMASRLFDGRRSDRHFAV